MQRAQNSIIGSIVADAATMGLHWIYNQQDLAAKVGSSSPAFFQPPSCPFYQYPSGRSSPYGAEIIPFLRSFAASNGIDKVAAAELNYQYFTEYGVSGRLNHVTKKFVENRDAGLAWDECPIEDHQAQGIIKMPLTVARYAGQPDLLDKVSDVVSVIHKSSVSLSSSRLIAIILERILLSQDTPAQAISWASSLTQLESDRFDQNMKDILALVTNDELAVQFSNFCKTFAAAAPSTDFFKRLGLQGKLVGHLLKTPSVAAALAELEQADKEYLQAIGVLDASFEYHPVASEELLPLHEIAGAFGLSCAVPSATLVSLFIARKSSTYTDAITTNIRCGGDNCSRALVIGGLFAAAADPAVSQVPAEWLAGTEAETLSEVTALASVVAGANPALASL